MTNEIKSPFIGRKKHNDEQQPQQQPQPLQQLQLQQQAQQMRDIEQERAKLEEEKNAFDKIKRDLKDLMDGIKTHEKVHEKEHHFHIVRHRGSGMLKSDSKESIPRAMREKEKEKEKEQDKEIRDKDKQKDKEKKKKNKEKKKAYGKDDGGVGKDIGNPFNVQHRVHVDFDYKWTGQHPDDVFELSQKLGEG